MYNAKLIEHFQVIETLVRLDNVVAEVNGYRYEVSHTSMYEVAVYKNGQFIFSVVFNSIGDLET